MGGSGYDPGRQVMRSSAPAQLDGKHRELVERAEVQFRSAARLLQANGKTDNARRAEQFAEWASLHLIEPHATHALYGVLMDSRPAHAVVDGILECALELLHADRGNVQLADPVTGELRIAAQCGFGNEFLEYFAVVTDSGSACGRAAQLATQVVITDVGTDPGFAEHRDIAAASGFRAVQSTPLTSADGKLVGMVSTHYSRPVRLPDRDLLTIRRFGTLIGERLGALLAKPQHAGRHLADTNPGQPGRWRDRRTEEKSGR